MLTKFHKILIGLLVVQLGLVVVMALRSGDSAPAKDQPIVAGFDAKLVTHVAITGDGKTVTLDKRGLNWVIASSFDYPADPAKLTELVSPIGQMSAAEPIATQASRHDQLKVGEQVFERKVAFTSEGKETVLYIGATVGQHRTAVRLGGDDRVYGASGISVTAAGVEPRDWLSPAYSKIERAEITRVQIQREGATIELARGTPSWTAAVNGTPIALATGETLETATIDRLVGDLAAIDVATPGDPKRDASKPTAVITIERSAPPAAGSGSGSGSAPSVSAAPPPPVIFDVIADGERYWVHLRGLPTAALVDKARLETAVTVDRDKLVKKAPPPAPGPGSGSATPKP
jgi:hypothetical protein